jgi:hypothetical protein
MMRQQMTSNGGDPRKMLAKPEEIPFARLIDPQNYNCSSLNEEIRADQHCSQLLKQFHCWLNEVRQEQALDAGQWAAGADYFLREFLIGARRLNIFSATAEQLRQFGGNWYITNNLEPNISELEPMLIGTALFYQYLTEQGVYTAQAATLFTAEAKALDFYKQRIESFHQLVDNGYRDWDLSCPVR